MSDYKDPREFLRLCTAAVTLGESRSATGYGTAFFVAPRHMITCAHVVIKADGTTAEPITITYGAECDDNVELVDATDSLYPDLALLKVKWADHPCVWLDGEANPPDDLYGYGFPWDERLIRGEPVSFKVEGNAQWSVKQGARSFPILKLRDGQARPGMSGSPLQNERTMAVCAILKRTRGEDTALGGFGVSATEVLNKFALVESAQREIRATRPLRRSHIHVATDPVLMEVRQAYGMSENSVRSAFWGDKPHESDTQQEIYSSTWKWMGAIADAARRNPDEADHLRELQNSVPKYDSEFHSMISWGRGIGSAKLTGNITLRNAGSNAHAVTVRHLSSRLTDPRIAEELNADIPSEILWLPGNVEIIAKVGPADIEQNLEFILQPNQPFQLRVSTDLEISAPETNFTPIWRSPLLHELDHLSAHQNSVLAYLNASLALRRYLLAGQIELTLGLSIDSNPVTRSIRVQIVLPGEGSTERRLLKNCVGFQNFGDFLIRWLAVRRGGVAQFFAERAPPEPSP